MGKAICPFLLLSGSCATTITPKGKFLPRGWRLKVPKEKKCTVFLPDYMRERSCEKVFVHLFQKQGEDL